MQFTSIHGVILLAALLHPFGSPAETLRSARAVARHCAVSPARATPFELTGRIIYMRRQGDVCAIGVEDESGSVAISVEGKARDVLLLQPGDTASFRGSVSAFSRDKSQIQLESHAFLSHGPAPTPADVRISDLLDGKMDYRLVRIRGMLRDAVTSETNPDWIILAVRSGRENIYVSVPKTKRVHDLDCLVGSRVTAVGICVPSDISPRDWFGRTFKVASPEDIVRDGATGPSRPPDISTIARVDPAGILSLGRHSASGKVVAVSCDGAGILRTVDGKYIRLDFADPAPPNCGQSIRAVGLPESDLYRINLVRVSWKPIPDLAIPEDRTRRTTLDEIFSAPPNAPYLGNTFFGKPITLTGETLNRPDEREDGILLLRNGNRICPVDVGSCAAAGKAPRGSVIEVTGVCMLMPDAAGTSSRFPRLDRILLITRSAKDLRIVARPPWWTPLRLASVLGILLVLLVAILIWNTILRRLVVRKSTALLKEQAAKLKETLKIDERTRLAAELHDYLAQNLTVVSYQISAAENAVGKKLDDAADYLANADRMLRSCRVDLRRCLWDLRNDTLDEPDFARAISRAVTPVAGHAALRVRFDVRRPKLSDLTAHAILSICRELVANAVRHGHADTIRIVGELRDGAISFSVRDNGRGFDPASRPNQSNGHFGLDGILERVKRLSGSMEIDSTPGAGTRIVVTLKEGKTK